MLEHRTDDCCTIQGALDRTGFTRFHLIGRKPPDGSSWSLGAVDEEANEIQTRFLVASDMERHV